MKLEFEKSSDIKFRNNPFSGSRVVPSCRTDITKLITSYRNFANASNTYLLCAERRIPAC